MKRVLKSKPILLVGLALLTITLANWGINFLCSKTYASLIANSTVVDAFNSGNSAAIDSVVSKKDLAYQLVVSGKIEYSSTPWLPDPEIIGYQQSFAEGVIQPDAAVALKSLQFYKLSRGISVYVMVPICANDCFDKMYLVYKKALL